jgi:hypothetical protein
VKKSFSFLTEWRLMLLLKRRRSEMAYTIQTDMSTGHHTHPLAWTGSEVVGICRFNEAKVYSTALEAAWALAGIKERSVKFYDLVITEQKNASRLPNIGNNGWMVRHPGYDLMY